MLKLHPETIVAMRDRLQERGARPSLMLGPSAPREVMEALQIVEEYGALCEAMYLMMSADGRVLGSEREVVRGALRELDERVRSAHVESMLDEAAKRLAADGPARRVAEVARALSDDPVRAEIAFVLAAAVAFADGEIADEENAMLNDLAFALGIDEAQANELLDGLDR